MLLLPRVIIDLILRSSFEDSLSVAACLESQGSHPMATPARTKLCCLGFRFGETLRLPLQGASCKLAMSCRSNLQINAAFQAKSLIHQAKSLIPLTCATQQLHRPPCSMLLDRSCALAIARDINPHPEGTSRNRMQVPGRWAPKGATRLIF